MIRKTVSLFLFLAIAAVPCVAQPEGAPDNGLLPPIAPPPPPAPEVDDSDVVFLKSGKELRGVKVVRENPMMVDIEFLKGETPLQIPRTHIERIEYAADRLSGRAKGVLGDLSMVPDIMPGEEVSPDFHRMLTAHMSPEEDLVFEEADYLVVLRQFAANYNAEIQVADALNNLPVEARQFSRVIPARTPFMRFLRNHLPEIAPDVRVILQYDKLLLQKREDVDTTPPADTETEVVEEAAPAE